MVAAEAKARPTAASTRTKKETKRKTRTETKAETTNDKVESRPSSADSIEQTPPPSSKKRKRDANVPAELEIDIGAPAPASKKALRKVKQQRKPSHNNPQAASIPSLKANGESESTDDGKEAEQSITSKRSEHGIWMGNLPWTATKPHIRTFLAEHAGIAEDQITRIHLPPPASSKAPPASSTKQKSDAAKNKGFAYIDFDSASALQKALGVSESLLGGRAVLIKDAKSFEGRPEKDTLGAAGAASANAKTKPPSDRIFVGNLGFDTTAADLRAHFSAACGDVGDVFVATFEDSGKCKGFAWVTFKEVEAAQKAVKAIAGAKKGERKGGTDAGLLHGRRLRCEFAEDAATRYKTRKRVA